MRKRLLLNGVIIIWAIAAGVFASLKPWQVYQQQNEETRKRTREMHAAETNREDLERREARARSDIGKEEAARKIGYVGPNEVQADSGSK